MGRLFCETFGFRVAWYNRSRQPDERIDAKPDVVVHELSELPALLNDQGPR